MLVKILKYIGFYVYNSSYLVLTMVSRKSSVFFAVTRYKVRHAYFRCITARRRPVEYIACMGLCALLEACRLYIRALNEHCGRRRVEYVAVF